MTKPPAWRRYLVFWRADIARDVDDELTFHTEMRVDEYMARGMTEHDARRAVAERLGDVDAARNECVGWGRVRDTHARRASVIDDLHTDVRYALRSLRRAPAWTAVALLTIALGVGATTTVFSIADTLLVRPFPYPAASRVFMAQRQWTLKGETVPTGLPFGMAKVWRERARTIEDAVLARGGNSAPMVIGSDTETVNTARVEPGFVAFAGEHLVIGRVPSPAELTPDSRLLFITEQFWRRQYGASADVIGKHVTLQGDDWTIVGVVPASLVLPDFRAQRADVLQLTESTQVAAGPVLVRLKPGVSRAAATAELDAIMQHANLADIRPVPMPLPLRLTRPQDWLAIREPIVMLTGAVALLLLVACTNVAHLLLARGAARQRELAVRHAIGAGRARLVRQLATESVVLALAGGALAVVVGWGGLRLLMALRPTDRKFDALSYVSATHGVVAVAAVLAIALGLIIGIVAALRSAGRDLAVELRVGAASTARGARRLRSLLVAGEVAVSATLLVGSLLLVHALFDLERRDVGFDARGLYGVTLHIPRGAKPAERAAFAADARERFAHVSGVTSAMVSDRVPAGRGFTMIAAWETPGHARRPEDANSGTDIYAVPPEYFAMMHMPLIAGRTFDAGSFARNEVIVSRSLANQVAPGSDPIGLRIRNAVVRSRGGNRIIPGKPQPPPEPDEPWQTIIGVVPDVMTNLVEGAKNAATYRPLTLDSTAPVGPGGTTITIVVRVATADGVDVPARLAGVASLLQRSGPPPAVIDVRETIDTSLAEPRFLMRVLAAFALLGVALAAIGLFGVISYSVGQRTREIGVRMTLGATRSSIARLVIGDGLRLALVGIVVGLAGAAVATRVLQSLLYGLSPFDPFAFAAGAALLLGAALAACLAPTLRATSVDPAIAVRAD